MAEAGDLKGPLVFLASRASSYVTGTSCASTVVYCVVRELPLFNRKWISSSVPSVIPIISAAGRARAGRPHVYKLAPQPAARSARSLDRWLRDVQLAVDIAKEGADELGGDDGVRRGESFARSRAHCANIGRPSRLWSRRKTGKSKKDALGETDAAIEMGFFVAG
jgi:hypothetical protein